MKGFGLTSLLIGAVLLLLIVGTVLLGYFMFTLSNATAFEWDSGDPLKAKTKGTETTEVWKTQKIQLMIPTVTNLLAMVAVALLYVMG